MLNGLFYQQLVFCHRSSIILTLKTEKIVDSY